MKSKCHFKWNNGNLAICCSKCGRIIKEGYQFTELEMMACQNAGSYYLPSQYCEHCESKMKNNE